VPWSDWLNAEIYERYSRERPLYPALNRHLVALAEMATARRVLDLACGTGATSRACLAAMPDDGELVGVDSSLPMVELARARVADPRASFHVVAASRMARAASGPFDRVVCNAAFGQFPDPGAVVAAVAEALVPGGLFVFDVPAAEVAGEATDVHPFQMALSRALARRRKGPGTIPPELDPRRLEERMVEAGFASLRRERFVYQGRQEELIELMEIPAMIARAAPGLAPRARAEALAEARRAADPGQVVRVPWVYFVARR
jgi:ubiquinone/menaquinone biosynthesis C-methylase UbiE